MTSLAAERPTRTQVLERFLFDWYRYGIVVIAVWRVGR